MGLFSTKKKDVPRLSREDSMSARPVLNRLVKVEYDDEDNIILHVPRPDNTTVRWLAKVFRLPPHKRVALDELGTFVIEHCDGEHTVDDIVDKFAKRFKLNRREAEVSMSTFLKNLARRSIIGLVLEEQQA
jgi:hypothetical protein